MRIFVYSLLIICLCSCQLLKKRSAIKPIINKATYQKYIPGEGGGKGILFVFNFANLKDSLHFSKLTVNQESLKFTSYEKGASFFIESSRFYSDPDRDPDGNGSQEEFAKSALFNAEKYTATLFYNSQDGQDSIVIDQFIALETLLYP